MPRNSVISVEVLDLGRGARVAVAIEGAVPMSLSESIGKYVSNVLSSGRSSRSARKVGAEIEASVSEHGSSSSFERVKPLLLKHFRYGSFMSGDIQIEFERASVGKLRSSTVTAYLLQLSDDTNGILECRHGVGGYEYLLRSDNINSQGSKVERVHATRSSIR